MFKVIRKLCWWVHRVLCFVGVHASDEVYVFVEGTDDFKPVGTFCPICMKHRDYPEEKKS